MSAESTTDAKYFLNYLQASGLREPSVVEALRRSGITDVDKLAQLLVEGGLEPWQVEQIRRGRVSLFRENFELLAEIGRGGMGIVYRARDREKLKDIVALKEINPDLDPTQKERAIRRFHQEIRTARHFDHPAIVRVLYPADDRSYYVMEYVPGLSLKRLLQDHQLCWADGLRLLIQAVEALNYVCERGGVHRDLSEKNLLVYECNNVIQLKLFDFGLGRIEGDAENESLTDPGQIFGTHVHLAPECGKGCVNINIRADLFSLGSVFYWVFSGQFPYPESNLLTRFTSYAWPTPASLHSLLRGFPERLGAIILKMMHPSLSERYQTPRAVLGDLERIALAAEVASTLVPRRAEEASEALTC